MCSTNVITVFSQGNYCNNCGKPKNQCVTNPRENSALGRKQQSQPTDVSPTVSKGTGKSSKGKGKGKGKGKISNEIQAFKKEMVAEMRKMFEGVKPDSLPKESSGNKDDTQDDTAPKKPTPGRELFVEFDGKPVNLDQLWELLRTNKATLGEDNERTIAIREAITKAQTLREEKMDPDQRASYLYEVLQRKTAESEKAQDEVQKLTDAAAEANKKLAEASEAANRVATELARVQETYEAAVKKKAEAAAKKVQATIIIDDNSSGTSPTEAQKTQPNVVNEVYATFLQRQLFRDWFKETSPAEHGFCEKLEWCLAKFPKNDIDNFSLWETHYRRVQKAVDHQHTLKGGAAIDARVQKIFDNGEVSAVWMSSQTTPYFPAEIQWVRREVQDRTTTLLEQLRKRAAESLPAPTAKRPKTTEYAVTKPFLLPDEEEDGIKEMDTTDVQYRKVDVEEAKDAYVSYLHENGRENEAKDLPDTLSKMETHERQIYEMWIKATTIHKDKIARFPTYTVYKEALLAGKYVA